VKTKTYEELKDFIFNLPVIDCHEHTMGPKFAPFYKEPIASLIQGYFQSDLLSAGATEKEMKILIPLIMCHLPVRNRIAVESIGEIADTNVNTLEKYLEACRKTF
jgi:predicted AAA+ superfamily ATPase